jgi:hypothetical protein
MLCVAQLLYMFPTAAAGVIESLSTAEISDTIFLEIKPTHTGIIGNHAKSIICGARQSSSTLVCRHTLPI